jgi:hypothetical protein
MPEGQNALLGLIPTIIGAGLVIWVFDSMLGAKAEQERLKRQGINTKIVKSQGKYKLKKVI